MSTTTPLISHRVSMHLIDSKYICKFVNVCTRHNSNDSFHLHESYIWNKQQIHYTNLKNKTKTIFLFFLSLWEGKWLLVKLYQLREVCVLILIKWTEWAQFTYSFVFLLK